MTPFDIGLHIAAAALAALIGCVILVMEKGTRRHKLIGRIWVALMTVVAIGSFRLFGIAENGWFSPIHALSIFTLASMAYAIFMIRRGNKRAHIGAMLGCFAGLLIAGALTLSPNRILGGFFFGN